jgi:heptosyltransferase-1
MRVLLIKTSSMGDVIHTLPALTDAGQHIPGISFDWVVEEAFAEIPAWHPLVREVIPVAWRRWRGEYLKGFLEKKTRLEWQAFYRRIRAQKYDLILDAQGLIKSAFLGFFARGPRAGLAWASAREAFASLSYQRKYTINNHDHAIARIRQLFSQALGYPFVPAVPEYGLTRSHAVAQSQDKYLVFLHGTTWATKLWPETYWTELAHYAAAAGYRIKIGGGNAVEVARANRIAQQVPAVDVHPYLSIGGMATLLAGATGAVAVDTGFGHLAAALDIPTVSLYGPTDPISIGTLGKSQTHLAASFPCAPCLGRTCTYPEKSAVTPACFTMLPPQKVWTVLQEQLAQFS